MKTCDTKKLWVHLPKVLFGLAGLLTVSVFIYGNQIKKINYQFSDVKKFYEKFVQANDREAESGDKAKLAVNNDVSLSTSQTLAVDWVSVYRDTPYQGPDSYIDFAIRQRKLRALNHIKPLKPEYGMVIYDVADYAYSFDANKTKCILDSGKPTLFVAIASVTGNFEKRRAIRETWLEQLLKTEWSHFNIAGAAFILGEPEDHYEQTMVSIEAQDHNDIIQVNVPDRFFDLNKKVVGLFNWLHKNCNEVDYLLKVDDDVYVNPFNIDKLLAMKKPLEPTMIGTSIGNPPSREGQWAISYDEWPWSQYPSYVTTAAVLITGSSITPLLAAFQTTPFMRFDDIYLAGICNEKANMKTVTTTRMNARGAPDETDPCMIYNTITWLTGAANNMRKWHSFTKDFYENVTKCSTDELNGGATVDPSAAVDFLLVY